MDRLDTFPGKELIGQYRQVFSTSAGKEILDHMLWELGLFAQIGDDNESIALKNYATRLVHILAGGELGKSAKQSFVYQLMKQPLPKEDE